MLVSVGRMRCRKLHDLYGATSHFGASIRLRLTANRMLQGCTIEGANAELPYTPHLASTLTVQSTVSTSYVYSLGRYMHCLFF